MLAFHNNQAIKDKYLFRVRAHKIADEIHQGEYVNEKDKKYCAVGCTLHSSDHAAYETELGIPIILARLEDGIFEGLPLERAKLWPEEFLDSINVGADLEPVWPKFAIWLLIDKDHGVIQYVKNVDHRKSIETVADYYSRYKEIIKDQWKNAAYAADYAAYAADYAAYAAAADAAVYAATAAAAVYAAAPAAAYAANAAANAADYAAYAANATNADVRKKHRIVQADKLLELLRECKKNYKD